MGGGGGGGWGERGVSARVDASFLYFYREAQPAFYLLGADVNVSHLHQLADHLHPPRTFGSRQSGEHHGRVAGVVLQVNVTRA